MALPNFDITAMDRRFLAELGRLQAAGSFSTYRELANQLAVQPATFYQLETGRYHCNVKLLYLLRSFHPDADIDWVLFGEAETGRPEPATLPVRERGRPVREH